MGVIKRVGIFALLVALVMVGQTSAMAGFFDFGGYVAKVDGATVSKKEFEDNLNTLINVYKQRFGVDLKDEKYKDSMTALKRNLVEEMIRLQVIKNEAGKMKISVSNADVDAKYNAMKSAIPKEQFEKLLKDQGVSESKLKEDIRQQLLIEKVIETVTPGLSVSDSKAREFYDKNSEKFSHPEQVRASHILIAADRSKLTDKARADLKEKAVAILKRAKAGEDFAKLARENSEDPGSKMNGGDLGYFSEKDMVSSFSKAAFSLKPGEVSDVVETQFGYHIIKVTDRRPAGKVSFDQAKEQIKAALLQQERGLAFQKWFNDVRSKAKVEVAKDYQFAEPAPIMAPTAPNAK